MNIKDQKLNQKSLDNKQKKNILERINKNKNQQYSMTLKGLKDRQYN